MKTKEKVIERILKYYELENVGINIGGATRDLLDLFFQQKKEIIKDIEKAQKLADMEQALETDLYLQKIIQKLTK